jgi:hypothetical protein
LSYFFHLLTRHSRRRLLVLSAEAAAGNLHDAAHRTVEGHANWEEEEGENRNFLSSADRRVARHSEGAKLLFQKSL